MVDQMRELTLPFDLLSIQLGLVKRLRGNPVQM